MSREIKFKAWSKEKKGFIAGFNMVNFHSYYTKGLEPEIYRYNTIWKLSEIELLQYTGLQDQKGREIYEGDILLDAWTKQVYEVKFGQCKKFAFTGWYCQNADRETALNSDYDTGVNNAIEVIGNIYQNPELLNQ